MTRIVFRKKMSALDIYHMNNWIDMNRRKDVIRNETIRHPDGTRTVSIDFVSQTDAIIFKLRFA